MYIYTNSKHLKERFGATPISWYEKNMLDDVPPNSSKDSKMGPRTKQRKKKKVGACSLTRNTLRVRGHAGASGWD